MANPCFFMMQVAGDKREEFFRRLKDFGRIYGISGSEENNLIKADGNCAWSINTAMIDYDCETNGRI